MTTWPWQRPPKRRFPATIELALSEESETPLDRLMSTINSICIGALIGLGSIVVLAILVIFIPMFARRYGMEIGRAMFPVSSEIPLMTERYDEMESDAGQMALITQNRSTQPQIEWESIMTDDEVANMKALRNDIKSMSDTSGYNVFMWPTLPYPVAGISNWGDRFERFSKIMDAVYNQEPELSVYTNGQNSCSAVAIAKYHLVDAESDDSKKNREEYVAVRQAADALDRKILSLMTGPECQWHLRSGHCTWDEMYVMLAYRELASRTSYSDNVDDTEHANDIYGALLEDESKCYGVTCAAKALLNRRGIPSFMASGNVDGNEDRRHAWIVLWIGNQWKTLDVTYAQRLDRPSVLDTIAATNGESGYWGGCMRPYDKYVSTQAMEVDQQCLDLMDAYEKRIGCDSKKPDATISDSDPRGDLIGSIRQGIESVIHEGLELRNEQE